MASRIGDASVESAPRPGYNQGLLRAMTEKREGHVGSSRRAKQAIILIACLAAAVVSAESTDASPRVLQVVQPQSGDRDPELQEILTRFLRIELVRAGLSPLAPEAGKPVQGAASYGRLVREHRAPFALIATYVRQGQQVDLQLEWFDASTASVSATENTDRSDRPRARRCRGLGSATASRPHRRQARSGRCARPPRSPTAALRCRRCWRAPSVPGSFYRFETSIALSAVLVNGYASDYFKYGFMPSAYAGYRFRVAGGALALGVSTGYSLFTIEDDLDEVGVQAAPIGIETRYEIGGGAAPGLPQARGGTSSPAVRARRRRRGSPKWCPAASRASASAFLWAVSLGSASKRATLSTWKRTTRSWASRPRSEAT